MGGHFSRKGRSESNQSVISPPQCVWKGEVIVVGDCGTGKTALLRQFSEMYWRHRDFDPSHDRIVSGRYNRLVELDSNQVKLQIWEGYSHPSLRQHNEPHSLWVNTKGVVLVYDVTREETFSNVAGWIKDMEYDGVRFVLVGNKCDCTDEKVVDYRRARDFADEREIPLFEVSAKDGTNVELAFITLAATIHKDAMLSIGVGDSFEADKAEVQ